MIPRVGGIAIKAGGPKQHFVFVVHAVFIVVFIKVVANTIVVVVERSRDAFKKFSSVGQAIAVPVIISPVHDTVVVVVPCGLFFAPETTGEAFLVNIQTTVVIVVGIFTVGDGVVVVVNVIEGRLAETLGHDSLVPNRLVESIVISVSVVAVIVIVVAVGPGEEIPVVLAGIVVKVEVAVNLKVIPYAVVIVVHVKPVEDGVVVIVQINGRIGKVTVNVSIHVVLEEVGSQFIGEVGFRAIVTVPLPDAGGQTNPRVECVPVIGHLIVGDSGVNGAVATEVVVPTADAFNRSATPVA